MLVLGTYFIDLPVLVLFLSGDSVEVYQYIASKYQMLSQYPRLIKEEFGVDPVPSSVDAGDRIDNNVYLLKSNMAYHYTFTGQLPTATYMFQAKFHFTENSDLNPLSAQPGSPLPSPPSDVTALIVDGSLMFAFSHRALYVFNLDTSFWQYVGVIISTPC